MEEGKHVFNLMGVCVCVETIDLPVLISRKIGGCFLKYFFYTSFFLFFFFFHAFFFAVCIFFPFLRFQFVLSFNSVKLFNKNIFLKKNTVSIAILRYSTLSSVMYIYSINA